jgi:hypothetical protein
MAFSLTFLSKNPYVAVPAVLIFVDQLGRFSGGCRRHIEEGGRLPPGTDSGNTGDAVAALTAVVRSVYRCPVPGGQLRVNLG